MVRLQGAILACMLALTGLLPLTGCGQRGPLYLPDVDRGRVTATEPGAAGASQAGTVPATERETRR